MNLPNITNATNYNVTFRCNDDGDQEIFFHILVAFSYIIIMLVSLIGNGIVVYLVLFRSKFLSVTNLFISNLSVGDMLMMVHCVPFTFISTIILQHWPFGGELCKTVSYVQAVSVFVSAYTLVAISLDRYIAIMHPLRPRMTKSHAKCIIALVWVIALLTASPIVFVSQIIEPNSYCGQQVCVEVWDSPERHFTYSVALMGLQYGIPFTVLVYTYSRIALVVWGKETPGEAENARDARLAGRKRKMIKMMVIVVIVYTICWLPYNILLILMDEHHEIGQWPGIKYMYFMLHWLAMSHTCYNPAIYVYMNDRFKFGFICVFNKIPCLRNFLPAVPYDTRSTSYAMSNLDHESSVRRPNACSTYVSTRSNKNGTPSASLLVHGVANDF